LKELLYVIVAPLTSLVALVAFMTWWSALLFVSLMVMFAAYAVRRHEKHSRMEAFDDKLSGERVERARKWLLQDKE